MPLYVHFWLSPTNLWYNGVSSSLLMVANCKMKNRTERMEFRLSTLEKARLVSRAQECNLDLASYIRKCTLEREPQFLNNENKKEIQELKKLALDLIRIGNLYHEQQKLNRPVIDKIKTFLNRFK